GVMLNNMMGEDDLHPDGFHSIPSGLRVGSMMSPTIIMKGDKITAVLGSGGSKRIRTAILQVIHNLLDRCMPVGEAVEAPRIHLDDDGVIQMEPGFSEEVSVSLAKRYPVNLWEGKDLYFGGVHTVTGELQGCGDSRRGGSFMRVEEK
ncbi:MAG: gamma-glutamyltransferase, partial [Desulfobacterales bacterium]|nr:gamma-glutamyltransferase [Desulfobacterales bacterium]